MREENVRRRSSECSKKDLNDVNVFYLIEDWATQDHMDNYLRSDRFSVLMGVLKVLCIEAEIKYQLSSAKLGAVIAET